MFAIVIAEKTYCSILSTLVYFVSNPIVTADVETVKQKCGFQSKSVWKKKKRKL